MARFNEEMTFAMQYHIFMEKMQAVTQNTIQANSKLPKDAVWDKVKEELIEFIREVDVNKITEE